jgi:predicted Fe-S protein YdhL (DUF1289 family)
LGYPDIPDFQEAAMTDNANKPISYADSPCVRNCCLDENDICLGCFRSISEICGWSKATVEERKEIMERCRIRYEQRRDRVRKREW